MADATDPDYGLLDRIGAGPMAFFPRPDPGPPPEGATDHRIEVAPGVEAAARFYRLGAEHPTLLYFHGNGEVVGDHDRFVHLFHEHGLNLFVAEYRGYGKSGGAPSMEALAADARPIAARFHALLDEEGYGPRRFAMGRSMGASPALEIAARAPDRFLGVVIESGAAGVRGMLERFGLAEREEALRLIAAHEAKIRSIRLPTMQLHGELDDLVPMSSAAELYGLLEDAPARELVIIPSGNHNTILWAGREPYMAALRRFVDAHSPPAE